MLSLRDRIYVIGISLGTNSSCVVLNSKGEWVCGYEEERFTKDKRESSFPINSLERCLYNIPVGSFLKIGLSHWFNEGFTSIDRYSIDVKSFIERKGYFIVGRLEDRIDHHFIHHISAIPFIDLPEDKAVNFLIIDGFGNDHNVLSVYRYNDFSSYRNPYFKVRDVYKMKNLYNSLGLFYERLTVACGLKPKGDEYKLLGYESEAERYRQKDWLNNRVSKGLSLLKQCPQSTIEDKESYLDFNALERVDIYWDIFWKELKQGLVEEEIRPVLGYIGQNILEKYIVDFVLENGLDKENLVLSGGVFYNVKLNNTLLNTCKERVEIVPPAGDQGGSIGIATYLYRDIYKKNPEKCDLLIGRRRHSQVSDEHIDRIVDELCKNGIVNLVHGDMEFAPRALCNTSTLCLPLRDNVAYINKLNNRDEAMPMAPVILEKNISYFFDEKEIDRSLNSRNYMITTYKYKSTIDYEKYSGVMHKIPFTDYYSGRPQTVSINSVIGKILEKVEERISIKCLINTSYNVHGHPICFSKSDVESDFSIQLRRDDQNRLSLFNFIEE
jgi:carbamoyltransferase